MERAAVENSFSAFLSYASVFDMNPKNEWSVLLDMEVSELDLSYKRIIADKYEIGIDLPLLSFNSGFMDGFINKYHKTFGFPDGGRSFRPDNEFLYTVSRNGKTVMKGLDGRSGLGDVRVSAKRELIKSDTCTVSAGAYLELPTGDASEGFGNGSWDKGVFVLVDKRFGDRYMGYFNAGLNSPGDYKGIETVSLKEYFYGGVGLEAMLTDSFSLLGQLVANNSPFPKTGIGTLDRPAVLLSLGGRYVRKDDVFELAFTEDPNTAGAPDFSLHFTVKRGF